MQLPGNVEPDRAARYRAEGWWDTCILADGIEAAAESRPDATAVVDGHRSLTYRRLADRVATAVTTLSAHGVRPGDAVMLVAGNSVEAVVAYHALLRIGSTAVVLDRRCGAGDVRAALDALPETSLAVVAADARERLFGGFDVPLLPLEPFAEDVTEPRAREWTEPDRDTPAVVLFTSGTTSRPKGVIHSLNTIDAGAANFALITAADERMVAFLVSPLTSSAGIMQMHLVAQQHATLVLEDDFDADASLERLNAAGATLLGGAPVIADRLLHAAARRADRRIALRTLALGGAMLPRPLLELATDDFGIEIVRVYGSSEAPNFSGSLPEDERDRRLADDGALMPGSEVRIGSAQHDQEGLLRGPGVFLGYVDPADNAAAFEEGWFRTGDIFEVHDGRLSVRGRLKEIVNRNGLKISLHEVDDALSGLPGALEYASFGLPDPVTGERLAVAVLPSGGRRLTLDDVVAHLVARGMARRKLPEELVLWDDPLPRTPSGKVVRARLAVESAGKPSQHADRLQ